MTQTTTGWGYCRQLNSPVFQFALEKDSLLEIDVVASEQNLSKLTSHPRLHKHLRISDDELRRLYQKAGVTFLPLSGFVANNAVLESAASGCPILIATAQQGGGEPQEGIARVGLDLEECWAQFEHLLQHRTEIGSSLRTWVEATYSWSAIGERTRQVLESRHP